MATKKKKAVKDVAPAKAKEVAEAAPPERVKLYSEYIRGLMHPRNDSIFQERMEAAMKNFGEHGSEQALFNEMDRAWKQFNALRTAVEREVPKED